ncbi:MAG: hypothetical protein KDA65_11295 [Planctomycetaceae bacterium]|nr:hypothetical protein [Planctomycetaceae bacterium]
MVATKLQNGNSNLLMLARVVGKINLNRLTDVAVQWLYDLAQYRVAVRLAESDPEEILNTAELREAEIESRRSLLGELNALILDQLQTERRNAERVVTRRTALHRERITRRAIGKAQAESQRAVDEAKHNLDRVHVFTSIFTPRDGDEPQPKRTDNGERQEFIELLREFQERTRRKYDYLERCNDLDDQWAQYETEEKQSWYKIREILLNQSIDDLLGFHFNDEGEAA